MSKYILDACALIAVLNKEDGAEVVRDLIDKANDNSVSISMNVVNLLEVYYGIRRELGQELADKVLSSVKSKSIKIIETNTEDISIEAGRLKSTYRISLADSLALTESSLSGAMLITSDHHEFDVIEAAENISLNWFR